MSTTPSVWFDAVPAHGTHGFQIDHQVLGLSNGNILVAWADDSGASTTAGRDIVGIIYNAIGSVVKGPFQLNQLRAVDDEGWPQLATLSNGGFIVSYQDRDSNGTGIAAEKYDGSGNRLSGHDIRLDLGAPILGGSDVATLSNDTSLFTYNYLTPNDFAIRGRIMDANGTLGNEFVIRPQSQTLGEDADPGSASVTALTNDTFVVAFTETVFGDRDVRAVGLDSSGNNLFSINVNQDQNHDAAPQVEPLAGGGFVIVWQNSNDVQARLYDASGTSQGSIFNIAALNAQEVDPAVVGLDDGGFFVAYHSTDSNSLFGKRYDATGTRVGDLVTIASTFPSLTGTNNKIKLDLTSDGRIIATWKGDDEQFFTSVYDPRTGSVTLDGTEGQGTSFPSSSSVLGSAEGETIFGHDGNDVINGASGSDYIYGGAGNDFLIGGFGHDVLNGQDGFDTIYGGHGVDVINGGDGDDTIYVQNGEQIDNVNGGNGDDTLNLSSWTTGLRIDNAAFQGPMGQTTSVSNIETFVGTQGDDFISRSNDTLKVTLIGEDGEDELIGGAGHDLIYGNEGNDTLRGGDGQDYMEGDEGDDILIGGHGKDYLYGGDGNDIFKYSFDPATGTDVRLDDIYGGGGVNTLDISGMQGSYTTTFEWQVIGDGNGNVGTLQDIHFYFDNNNDGRVIDSAASLRLYMSGGNDYVSESTNGDGGLDFVDLGAGDDTYKVGNTAFDADTISGSFGSDLIDFSDRGYGNAVGFDMETGVLASGGNSKTFDSFENVIAGFDDWTVLGTTGENTITGAWGDDLLQGGAGGDVLTGGAGNNQLLGGDGNDTLIGAFYNANTLELFVDTVDGGTGYDILSFEPINISGLVIDFTTGLVTLPDSSTRTFNNIEAFVDGDGSNELRDGNMTTDLFGGGGDDHIIGHASAGLDKFYGGDGNDTITVGHNDLFFDFFVGGAGTDLIDYSNIAIAGSDIVLNMATGQAVIDGSYDAAMQQFENLQGSLSGEQIIGTGGNNEISGNQGDDHIQAGAGFDILAGDGGNDILDGGADFDLADFRNAGGDLVVNFNTNVVTDIALGTNTLINIEGAYGGLGNDRFFGKDGNDSFYGEGGNDTFSTFGGLDSVVGGDGNDRAFLGDGNDFASGGNGADTLNGEAGRDTLLGDEGNDRLYGGAGDDVLQAHAGDDLLVGGAGNDQMYAGDGNDRLFVDAADDRNNIDGGAGSDRLIGQGSVGISYDLATHNLEGALGTAGHDRLIGASLVLRTVLVGKNGDDVLAGGAGNDLLEGRNDLDQLTGNDGDDYLTGQAGDDQADGGNGNDTLFGGTGNDILIGGNGNDFIQGDAGSDTLQGGDGDDDIRIDSTDSGGNISGGNGFDTVRLLGSDDYDFSLTAGEFERGYGNSGANELSAAGASSAVTIYGLDGNDTLTGSAFDDLLVAGNGDDLVAVGAGADSANGGGGSDIALFSGNQADYDVVIVNPGISARVTHIASGDVNTLSAFEFAQFDDGTIAI